MNSTKELAIRVNNLLTEYIDIHDLILKHSFRKILPIPGIFKRIDFGGHERQLHKIVEEIESAGEAIPRIREEEPDHSEFLDAMSPYLIALVDAVRRLEAISGKLHEKAEGIRDYSMREYKREMDEYKTAVSSYMAVGEPLQVLLPTI